MTKSQRLKGIFDPPHLKGVAEPPRLKKVSEPLRLKQVFLDQQKNVFDCSTENGHGVISFDGLYDYHRAKAAKSKSVDPHEVLLELASRIMVHCP